MQTADMLDTTVSKHVSLPYLLSLPQGYDTNNTKTWPLILFLHGAGERGDNDMIKLRKNGIPKLADSWDQPFITVSPQCPANMTWLAKMDDIIGLLDDVCAGYRVDPKRIYLTGISMGGYGAWQIACMQSSRFAAVVPICGGWPYMYRAIEIVALIKDVPIWVFHGAKDNRVPLVESLLLVAALQAMHGNVRLTVYPDAGHDSWTRTYDNPELYTWLLQQSR